MKSSPIRPAVPSVTRVTYLGWMSWAKSMLRLGRQIFLPDPPASSIGSQRVIFRPWLDRFQLTERHGCPSACRMYHRIGFVPEHDVRSAGCDNTIRENAMRIIQETTNASDPSFTVRCDDCGNTLIIDEYCPDVTCENCGRTEPWDNLWAQWEFDKVGFERKRAEHKARAEMYCHRPFAHLAADVQAWAWDEIHPHNGKNPLRQMAFEQLFGGRMRSLVMQLEAMDKADMSSDMSDLATCQSTSSHQETEEASASEASKSLPRHHLALSVIDLHEGKSTGSTGFSTCSPLERFHGRKRRDHGTRRVSGLRTLLQRRRLRHRRSAVRSDLARASGVRRHRLGLEGR